MRWSVKRMRAVFKRKVWSECENGEWNWGEKAWIFARFAREDPRFRRATSDFEKKTTVLQSRYCAKRMAPIHMLSHSVLLLLSVLELKYGVGS